MEKDIIKTIEIIVMEYAGPMGKFVVRQQIKNINKDLMNLTPQEKEELVKKIVYSAIYNEKYQKICLNRLMKILTGKTLVV